MDRVRILVGGWLYYLGYRILPSRIRKRVSQINGIGLEWIKRDFPDRFEIRVEQ